MGAVSSDGPTFYFAGGGHVWGATAGEDGHRVVADEMTLPSDATHFMGQGLTARAGRLAWTESWWSYRDPTTRSAVSVAIVTP